MNIVFFSQLTYHISTTFPSLKYGLPPSDKLPCTCPAPHLLRARTTMYCWLQKFCIKLLTKMLILVIDVHGKGNIWVCTLIFQGTSVFFSWLSMFVCFPCSVWCLVALAISLSSCFQINLCVSNCLLVVFQYQKICLNTHFLLAICIRNWCHKAKPLECNFCASC